MRVTIFGLGLHGGGCAAARYFAQRNHHVLVTDLRSREELAPSLKPLEGFDNITYTLGIHRREDIAQSDIVIKNSALGWDHPLLSEAPRIETDLSWMLPRISRKLICITGTKGKTTLAYLLQHLLKRIYPHCDLAGNMGISLFSLDRLAAQDPLILELSSWQLRDLRMLGVPLNHSGSLLTSLYPDHLEGGYSLDQYIQDKEYLFSQPGGWAIIPKDLPYSFRVTRTPLIHPELINPGIPGLLGETASLAVSAAEQLGLSRTEALKKMQTFQCRAHRIQMIGTYRGISWINDSAATIPEAVLKAVESIKPDHLIAGGTDKGLSPEVFAQIVSRCQSVHLLSGSFSDKLLHRFPDKFYGPFPAIEQALSSVLAHAQPGQRVLFSPGAASFEYFLHAQQRGEQFINAVKNLDHMRPEHG